MNNIKKYLRIAGYFSVSIILIAFFTTLLNYLTSISENFISILHIILIGGFSFYIGFKQGKSSDKKGWVSGLINGSIICTTLLLLSLVFFTKSIKYSTFVYYGIIILVTSFGAIVGKNKKANT